MKISELPLDIQADVASARLAGESIYINVATRGWDGRMIEPLRQWINGSFKGWEVQRIEFDASGIVDIYWYVTKSGMGGKPHSGVEI